jgi:hypothetical protein
MSSKTPVRMKPKPNAIPRGKIIFLLMVDALLSPNILLPSRAFGLFSKYFFANAGFIRDLIEKNKLRIPSPIKNKE